jgi:hypothetical protein
LGTAGQSLVVNSGADGLEFGAASGGGVTVYTGLSGTDGTPSGATYLLNASSPSAGDLAYVTANTSLYQNNGNGWYRIAVINTTPTISSVADASSNTTPFTLTAGTNTVITVTASDVDEGTDLTYSHSVTSGSLNGTTVTQGTGASENVFTITPHASNATTFSITFTVSDSINAATSVAAFTLAFAITDSHYTSLLVATDAAAGDNNDITDSSSNSYTITASGDAHAGTFSPYRHGGYSTYFDGTGDFLSISSSSDFNIGADATFECWCYPTATASASPGDLLLLVYGGSNNTAWLSYTGASKFEFRLGYTGSWAQTLTSTNTFGLNQWYHVVGVRSSGTSYLFVNGVQEASGSNSTDLSALGNSVYVGAQGAVRQFQGYISDARIVNGTAIYTSAFTPPTGRLTAVTNTKLLTCHLPYISDGSSSGHAITVNGNTSTEPIGPYDYTEYSESDNGGSLHFDGSGDYVRISSIADLSGGSWTIEGWYYFEDDPNVPANAVLWTLNSQATLGYALMNLNGANLVLQQRGTSTYTSSAAYDFDVNRWYHIAAVWNNSANTMRAYVNGKQVIASTTNPIQNAGNGLTLGTDGYGAYPIKGFISDFRIKQTAEYTSEFTPPTAPLSSSSTVLHIKGTDAHVLDKSQGDNLKLVANAAAVTNATNNSNISSTNALYFNGGDYLISDTCGDIGVSGLDYTIEAWIYITAWPTAGGGIFSKGTAGTTSSGDIIALDVRTNEIRFHTDGNYVSASLTTSTSLSLNTWYHVAVSREGNVHRLFLNGTLEGSTTQSYNVSSTSVSYIGTNQYDLGASTRSFYGYMQDLRVTKGLARYTSNFTVPSAHLKG